MQPDDRSTTLVSAALRHVLDAERLIPDSPDQSWHLAGFGPECVRKACLAGDWLDLVLGHTLDDAATPVLDLAIALDPRAGRYVMRQIHPIFARWHPNARYDRTGSHDEPTVRPLVDAAREFTLALATELWMDGRVGEV